MTLADEPSAPPPDEKAGPSTATAWRRRALSLAFRINLAHTLAAWAPWIVGLSVPATVVLLVLRRNDAELGLFWNAVLGLVPLTLVAAVAGARWRRESIPDALVRLDLALGLHNRLTSAEAGVGPWPPLPPSRDVVRWRVLRTSAPLAFGAALLTAAAWVPVSPPPRPEIARRELPPAWREMEESIEGLAERDLVTEEAAAAWEERLNRLRHQPEDAWYSHGSLEAGDTLREQLETSVRTLGENLDRAADATEALGSEHRESDLKETDSQLRGALEGLSKGSLPLDRRLLDRLKQIQPSRARSLSMREVSALSQRLREGAGFCRTSFRECRAGDQGCIGWSRGRRARGGGVDRGPGSVPLSLDPDAVRLDAAREEGVTNSDLEHAALGDTIGQSRAAHDVNEGAYRGPVAGGAAARGQGGEAVAPLPATPEERRVLERYFR